VSVTGSTEKAKPRDNARLSWRIPWRQVLLIGGSFILGFVFLGIIAISVWDYSNSTEFCANACHDVHPEEIPAYRDSFHANVKCTECHMGRVGTLRNIVLKASHFQHLPAVIFDTYDRPLESETLRPANESCELCHWPPAFHGDTVREVRRFLPDAENSEERTYLILKTGAGTREQGLGYGIHWHITNPVEYIATEEGKQKIPWVRTTLPDARTVEYYEVTNTLSSQEIEEAEKHTMDCVDCHNRMGHPFPPPDDLIDEAMADGRLSTDLPYVKQYMLDLLTADYTSQVEALEAVSMFRDRYQEAHPEAAAAYPEELARAEELAEEFVTRLIFEEPGITWRSFYDNNKHKDFPGCFRCHDGKHETEVGESIRLHCNICHSIPETVSGDARPPQMPLAYIQEPSSHLETSFMADHRFQASDECATCHGEIEFGTDDSSFCANSACHRRAWPEVELDAGFVHPIELVGQHAEVWCNDCHEGERMPEYVCANCHEPPEPHFGPVCEDCHTPTGFDQATLPPEIPHPLEGRDDCLLCHDPAGNIQPAPSNHVDYEVAQCTLCHKPGE
jgi:hypothetical protein